MSKKLESEPKTEVINGRLHINGVPVPLSMDEARASKTQYKTPVETKNYEDASKNIEMPHEPKVPANDFVVSESSPNPSDFKDPNIKAIMDKYGSGVEDKSNYKTLESGGPTIDC